MNEQRLGKSGHADQQTVTAAKECIKRGGNDFLLTNDDFANFLLERVDPRRELIENCNRVALNDGRSGRKSRRRLFIHKIVRCLKVSAKCDGLQANLCVQIAQVYEQG